MFPFTFRNSLFKKQFRNESIEENHHDRITRKDSRLHRNLKIIPKINIPGTVTGSYRSRIKGNGLTFKEIREYQPGDEIKRIHWKATARSNKTYVKSYDEEKIIRILFALDLSSSVCCNNSFQTSSYTKMFEFVETISTIALKSNNQVGIYTFGESKIDFIEPSNRKSQLDKILDCIRNKERTTTQTNFSNSLMQLRGIYKKPSIVFLISDFFSDNLEDSIKQFFKNNDLIGVHLSNSITKSIPPVGLFSFVDSETNQLVQIDLSNKKQIEILLEKEEKRVFSIEQIFKNLSGDFITISEDPIKPLFDLMKKREKKFR